MGESISKPLHVLIVEDLEDDALLIVGELRRGGYEPVFERVQTPEAMSQALEGRDWDLVTADYSLPGFSAPAALALLQEREIDIPFIVVSGTIGEETAVAAMRAGAHDYLMKGNLARLAPAVERELREAEVREASRNDQLALRESEERYRGMFEGVFDAILVESLTGKILDANVRACEMFGWSREELRSKTEADLALEGQPAIIPTKMTAEKIPPAPIETVHVRASGEHFPAEVTARIQRIAGEKVLLVVIRDITDRKRDEEQIRRQLSRLQALRNIDLAITASLDLSLTFSVLLDQVVSNLGVDAADVMVYDRHTRRLSFAAGRGFHAPPPEGRTQRIGEGLAGKAALDRTLLSIQRLSDAEEDLGPDDSYIEEGFVTYHAAPLVAKGTVMGVLEVLHRTEISPDQEWMDFLEAIAGHAAIAIDNATLFEELHRSSQELIEAYDSTLEGWIGALDLRDKETEGHTQRVTEMAVRLAKAMGLGDEELVHVRRGALLHDIGKMGVPDSILLKPGALRDDEWEIMCQHPVNARKLLSPIAFLRPALNIPYCHHEKWDGTGYPVGLKGKEIPIEARIFSVVDVWDALLSDRPYREAWAKGKVREYIQEQTGRQFDPTVVEAFLAHERELV